MLILVIILNIVVLRDHVKYEVKAFLAYSMNHKENVYDFQTFLIGQRDAKILTVLPDVNWRL